MNVYIDGWVEWMDACMEGGRDGWMDAWMYGWMHGWMDGRTEEWRDVSYRGLTNQTLS